MDLSIFERVFALRDEVRKAQFGADAPDPGPGGDGGEIVLPPSLPQEKLAADLMARAMALREQATRSEGKNGSSSRDAIAELLHSASARFPEFDESDLATARAAPTASTEGSHFISELETRHEVARPASVEKDAPEKKKGGIRKRK